MWGRSGIPPKCRGKTIERGHVRRQTEPKQIVRMVEPAAPDMLACETGMDISGIATPGQAEQRRAVNDLKTTFGQNPIQRLRHLAEIAAHSLRPVMVAQGSGADGERRSGTGPGAKRSRNPRGNRRRSNGESQPDAGQAVEFAERAQDDDGIIATQRNGTRSRTGVDKRFIDDKPSAVALDSACGLHQRGMINDAPIGVIGIDHDHMRRARDRLLDRTDIDHLAPRGAPCNGVLAVGGADHGGGTGRRQTRQPLNQGLGAGRGDDVHMDRNMIGRTSGSNQRIVGGTGRQTLPGLGRKNGWNRPGTRIDSGREIEPRRRAAAVLRDCIAEITTVFHGRFMPSSFGKREGVRGLFGMLAALAAISVLTAPARAAELPRVASINLCTDQLLITLADPGQILGLSPYARDPARSWAAAEAARYPILSGEAEDVLELKPDLVVAGRFTKRATRELLKAQGVKVVEFDAVRSIEDTKAQIKRMGDVLGHPDRALAQIARIETTVARARETVARKPLRILAVSRRGWISGSDSLTSSLLATIGIANAASDFSYKLGGFASLEAIVTAKPDFLLVSEDSEFAEDQGRAFLLHPALEQLYPPSKRLVLSERLTVCGGPMLADALDRLVTEFARVEH